MSKPGNASLVTNEERKYYYLKAMAHPASPLGRYTGRYVRYTGSGHNDVVLTEAHPVFLKFYHEDGKSLATFKDLILGFKMKTSSPLDDGLRAVEMFKDQEGDRGFYFDADDGDRLKWRDEVSSTGATKWAGWVLRDCPPEQYKGNPQLFWASSSTSEGVLPDGVEWINLVAEYL
jgi:hypothetical protein